MELRHLRYFLAAGEALSFTKAAARLAARTGVGAPSPKNVAAQIQRWKKLLK